MYNLVVSGNLSALDGIPFVLSTDRVLKPAEYTEDALAERFGGLDVAAARALTSLPAVFAYETGLRKAARIGAINRIRKRAGQVRLDYTLDAEIPPIAPSALESAAWELDLGRDELHRTHWAVKSPDLFEALVEGGIFHSSAIASLRRLQGPSNDRSNATVVAPSVFRVPPMPPQADLVAVMMPFREDFAPVWQTIQRRCASAGLRCLRANDIWNDSVLVQDIFELLWTSSIVIADFTGRNANVMYETGIAHTLGRAVVPISQAQTDVPFDLQTPPLLEVRDCGDRIDRNGEYADQATSHARTARLGLG